MNNNLLKLTTFFMRCLPFAIFSVQGAMSEAERLQLSIERQNIEVFAKPNLLTQQIGVHEKNGWYNLINQINQYISSIRLSGKPQRDLEAIVSSLRNVSDNIFNTLSVIYANEISPTLTPEARAKGGFELAKQWIKGRDTFKDPAALRELDLKIQKAKNAVENVNELKANLNNIKLHLDSHLQPELEVTKMLKRAIEIMLGAEKQRWWWQDKGLTDALETVQRLNLILEINLERILDSDYNILEKFVDSIEG